MQSYLKSMVLSIFLFISAQFVYAQDSNSIPFLEITIGDEQWDPDYVRLNDVLSYNLTVNLRTDRIEDSNQPEKLLLRLYLGDPGKYTFTSGEGPVFTIGDSLSYSYTNTEGTYLIKKHDRSQHILTGQCLFRLENTANDTLDFKVDFEFRYKVRGMKLN